MIHHSHINPEIIESLKELIKSEAENLSANDVLEDEREYLRIKIKIADAKIMLLRLEGHLPL